MCDGHAARRHDADSEASEIRSFLLTALPRPGPESCRRTAAARLAGRGRRQDAGRRSAEPPCGRLPFRRCRPPLPPGRRAGAASSAHRRREMAVAAALANRELRQPALVLLSFDARQLRANQRPMDGTFFEFDRRRVAGVGAHVRRPSATRRRSSTASASAVARRSSAAGAT